MNTSLSGGQKDNAEVGNLETMFSNRPLGSFFAFLCYNKCMTTPEIEKPAITSDQTKNPECMSEEEILAEFWREIKALKNFNHLARVREKFMAEVEKEKKI